MILILSTCQQKLSEDEFVRPIEKILSKEDHRTKHYTEEFDPADYDSIIICGTAMMDFDYLNHLDKFSWLKDYTRCVLGICSGAQIIARVLGLELRDETLIGTRDVSVTTENGLANGKFRSYFLISKRPILRNFSVALDQDEYMFKIIDRDFYGLLFHPEVLNPEMIVRFCSI
jgi:GMP synthase-like glutamine amidotransferase